MKKIGLLESRWISGGLIFFFFVCLGPGVVFSEDRQESPEVVLDEQGIVRKIKDHVRYYGEELQPEDLEAEDLARADDGDLHVHKDLVMKVGKGRKVFKLADNVYRTESYEDYTERRIEEITAHFSAQIEALEERMDELEKKSELSNVKPKVTQIL